MTPEGKVKKQVREFLNSLGADCWYFSPMMMGYGKKGVPDIIGCYRGFFFSVECKAPGKKKFTTVWQDTQLNAINIALGRALVVDDVELLKAHWKDTMGWKQRAL